MLDRGASPTGLFLRGTQKLSLLSQRRQPHFIGDGADEAGLVILIR
jgi:hypothetical protein